MSSINFGGLVDVQLDRRPDSPAIITVDRTWTFDDLAETVHAFAAFLEAAGVRSADRVALLAMNSGEYVCALLAIYRLGAIAVPLNYRLKEEELTYLLSDSGATAVIADDQFIPVLEKTLQTNDSVRTKVCFDASVAEPWESFDQIIASHRGKKVPLADVDFDTVQRIMYTSGTTSRPKGALITHGMTLCNIAVQTTELQLLDTDRILVSSPLYHIAAMDAPGLCTLFQGGAIVLLRKFDANVALDMIAQHRVTGAIFVQSMLHLLRDASGDSDLSSFRWIIFGAASGELYRDIRARFPQARLIQSYGMTECCSMIANVPESLMVEKYGTVGKAVPFVEYKVVNENDVSLSPGEAGEIVVRGAKVTPGYWGDPERTEEAWRGGWLHTGDVGVMDVDGFLSITDRLKDMIRSGGENVASSEIERVIYEHSGVQEVAVIGVADSRWQEVPKAFIVLKPGCEVSSNEMIDHCRARLASFKTPKYVEFIESLPRNPSGKVLKRSLRT